MGIRRIVFSGRKTQAAPPSEAAPEPVKSKKKKRGNSVSASGRKKGSAQESSSSTSKGSCSSTDSESVVKLSKKTRRAKVKSFKKKKSKANALFSPRKGGRPRLDKKMKQNVSSLELMMSTHEPRKSRSNSAAPKPSRKASSKKPSSQKISRRDLCELSPEQSAATKKPSSQKLSRRDLCELNPKKATTSNTKKQLKKDAALAKSCRSSTNSSRSKRSSSLSRSLHVISPETFEADLPEEEVEEYTVDLFTRSTRQSQPRRCRSQGALAAPRPRRSRSQGALAGRGPRASREERADSKMSRPSKGAETIELKTALEVSQREKTTISTEKFNLEIQYEEEKEKREKLESKVRQLERQVRAADTAKISERSTEEANKMMAELEAENTELKSKLKKERRELERIMFEKEKEMTELNETIENIMQNNLSVGGTDSSGRLLGELTQAKAKIRDLEGQVASFCKELKEKDLAMKAFTDNMNSTVSSGDNDSSEAAKLQIENRNLETKMKEKDETIDHLMSQLKKLKLCRKAAADAPEPEMEKSSFHAMRTFSRRHLSMGFLTDEDD